MAPIAQWQWPDTQEPYTQLPRCIFPGVNTILHGRGDSVELRWHQLVVSSPQICC